MDDRELIRAALQARRRAYSPYSRFQVGAALLAVSGKVYTGCNIENAAYSPSNCAERTAFFKAVSDGVYDFAAIAIAGGDKDARDLEICSPCGVCRQVLQEFAPDLQVILVNCDGETLDLTLPELLPYGFDNSYLG